MATAIFNTSASAIDGFAKRDTVDETWATIRAGAGNGTGTGSGSFFCGWNGSSTTNQFSRLDRMIFVFNTASLGTGAIVTAATIDLYHTTKSTPSDTTAAKVAVHIVASTPASTSSLANSDYGQLGATSFANIAWASLSGNAYNTFTLDANGLANISVSGFSKFGMITGADLNNSAPTTTGSGDLMRVRWQAHDDANKPKLTVTYTPPPTKPAFLLNFM